MQVKKVGFFYQILNGQKLRELLVSSKESLKKKIVINVFTFFDAGIFLFKKQKMAIQHRWVNDENDEAHVSKLILVLR